MLLLTSITLLSDLETLIVPGNAVKVTFSELIHITFDELSYVFIMNASVSFVLLGNIIPSNVIHIKLLFVEANYIFVVYTYII